MIRMHFPSATDSPTGSTPVSLRIRVAPRLNTVGGAVSVHFKRQADAVTAQAFAGYQQAGAWIETDDATAARRLREALGDAADVRFSPAGAAP